MINQKWQSKFFFSVIFHLCSLIVKNVVDCRLSGVLIVFTRNGSRMEWAIATSLYFYQITGFFYKFCTTEQILVRFFIHWCYVVHCFFYSSCVMESLEQGVI